MFPEFISPQHPRTSIKKLKVSYPRALVPFPMNIIIRLLISLAVLLAYSFNDVLFLKWYFIDPQISFYYSSYYFLMYTDNVLLGTERNKNYTNKQTGFPSTHIYSLYFVPPLTWHSPSTTLLEFFIQFYLLLLSEWINWSFV